MKWMRFRIRTNPASEDRMIAAMMEIGLTGAQIEDKVPLTAAEKPMSVFLQKRMSATTSR